MKQLLRSCLVVDVEDKEDLFVQNYHALVSSGLVFDTPEDNVIWTFICEFFGTHGHIPHIQTLRAHFDSIREVDVVDRLERLALLSPKVRGDYLHHLEEKSKDRKNRQTLELLKEAIQIVSTGVEISESRGKKVKLHGAIDAIHRIFNRSADIIAPTLSGKISGNITRDGEDLRSHYNHVKSDPLYNVGQHCGLRDIDATMNGAKRHELWIHAAFSGHLKSTFAMHWAYVQAVYFGFSSVYFSLEMPYSQCRNLIYAMHTAHEDFKEIRHSLGITSIGLDYEKIRDGRLEPNEEKFFLDYVIPDLNGESVVAHDGEHSIDPSNYGSIHLEVCDPQKSDFTVADMQQRSELIYSKSPFNMIILDHIGLMGSRNRYSNTTEKLNEVIRDIKHFANYFNRGMGIALVGLYQINREGFRTAEKNGGRYNLTHLSYASECERSADIVTATWIDDELRKMNRALFQCLKSRDQKPFDRLPVRIEFPCRRFITDDSISIEEIEEKVRSAKAEQRGEEESSWKKKKGKANVADHVIPDINLDL